MDEDEIEQQEVSQAGRAEEPVASGFGPPDPDENGQEHGVRQADYQLKPERPVVEFGHERDTKGTASSLRGLRWNHKVFQERGTKVMKRSARIAGYNLCTLSMSSSFSGSGPAAASPRLSASCSPFAASFLLVLFLLGTAQAAAPWAEPSRDLARKIADVTGPGAVAWDVTNRSSLNKADLGLIRTALGTELSGHGLRLAPGDQAAANVAVTLSENVREFVWVAEIQVGKNEKSVVMVAVPRADAALAPVSASGVVLRKQLLWSQEDPILDVAALDSGAHMAVLDGSKLTLLHLEKGRWQPDQELPVQHAQAWPRDLRGRLVLGKDHLLDVYLPGVFCATSSKGTLALDCAARDEAWPVDGAGAGLRAAFDAKRNYFAGGVSPALGKFSAVPPFYSTVSLPRGKYMLWVFAAADGTVHAVDGMTDQIWRGVPWGSDIASVHTGCGGGWQVAAAGKSDAGSDELRIYDVPDREPMAMSAPLNFPGRITALWGGAEAQALVVSHNEEASRYEAYRVLFTCGD